KSRFLPSTVATLETEYVQPAAASQKGKARYMVKENNGFGISSKLVGRSFADRSPTGGGRALAKASGTR
ncbi:MAG TPA: hypothetical protein VMM76_19405, partial [Pirellulaceae bacterium]|nr:hypothetical protein [Pirellulaceae bacterium]